MCSFPVPQSLPECQADSQCTSDKACINQRCQDPCAANIPCGTNAECRVSQHRPTCYCLDGWGGNPQVQCYKRKNYCKILLINDILSFYITILIGMFYFSSGM